MNAKSKTAPGTLIDQMFQIGYFFLTNMAMPLTKLVIFNNKVQFVNIIVNSLVTMTMNITFIAVHHVTQPLSFTR